MGASDLTNGEALDLEDFGEGTKGEAVGKAIGVGVVGGAFLTSGREVCGETRVVEALSNEVVIAL